MSKKGSGNFNRRKFIGALSSGLVLPFAAPSFVRAQSKETIVVSAGGGAYEQAYKETVIQPFMKETGIDVIYKTQLTESNIKAQVDSGNVQVDVCELTGTPFRQNPQELLEEVDYSHFAKDTLAGLLPQAKQKYGVGSFVYSSVMAFSLDDWPNGKPRPNTWAEFWDLKKFPGPRTLQSASAGHATTLAFALIADGVDPKNLYPLDLDRAFKSLDRIKSRVTKFWTIGVEPAQLLSDRQVTLGSAWNGRIQTIIDQHAPVDFTWNQAELSQAYWMVPKGTKHKEAAMRFLAYTSSAAAQARFESRLAYGPTNTNAIKLMDPKIAARLPTAPGNLEKQFWRDDRWLNQLGANGKPNRDIMIDRWTKWVIS